MASLGSSAALCALERGAWASDQTDPIGEALASIPFINEGHVEMDAAFGSELDGRLYSSLDGINEKSPVTPEKKFYVRTRASRLLPPAEGWKITVDGLTAAKHAITINIADLRSREESLGLHLMECAGNTRAAHFGMMSVGNWSGAPISSLLHEWNALPGATQLMVSGFDKYTTRSVTSLEGASWIFSFEQLTKAGAFLATKLNGKPLSPDHGAPVRLVVPGWYGCTCIKWVDRISFVNDSAEATSQMAEYAQRTHQNGIPRLARDFLPARIEHAAMPVRVEKLRVDGGLRYRVVGILWGGSATVAKLGIRFNPEEDYAPVESLMVPQTTPWTVWSHIWAPKERGRYTIRLVVLEPKEQPKRLESGYYARTVEIEEI